MKRAPECKTVIRGMFGFFRKPKGAGTYLEAAKHTIRALSQLFIDSKATPAIVERLENELYFHTMTSMYLEGRTNIRQHYTDLLDIMSHGAAAYLTPERRYKFKVFLFAYRFFNESSYLYVLSKPTDYWTYTTNSYLMAEEFNKSRELLIQAGKGITDFLVDLAESIRSRHINCWEYESYCSSYISSFLLDSLDYASKVEIAGALVSVIVKPPSDSMLQLTIDEPMVSLINGFVADLGVDRRDVGMSAVTRRLLGHWVESSKSPKGYKYYLDRTQDPMGEMPVNLPVYTDDEIAALNKAMSDAKAKELLYTFLLYKEGPRRELDSANLKLLLEESLIDYTVFSFPSHEYLSGRNPGYIKHGFISQTKNALKVKLEQAVGRMGDDVDRASVLYRLSSHVDVLGVFKSSVVMPLIFTAAKGYLTAVASKYAEVITAHRACFKLFEKAFDVETPSQLNWINTPCSSSNVFTPIQLKFDLALLDQDLKTLEARVDKRSDTTNEKLVQLLFDYATITILKTIVREVNKEKVDNLKFKPKDISF